MQKQNKVLKLIQLYNNAIDGAAKDKLFRLAVSAIRGLDKEQ